MSKFFSFAFWFNQRPGALVSFWKTILVVIIFSSLILSIFTFIIKKHNSFYANITEKIFNFFTLNFFISLFLFFFNQESIPMLSSRFWYIVWFIIMAIWAISIIRCALKLPDKKRKFEKEKEFQKYLPR